MLNIVYIFKKGRKARINKKTKFPSEFFYGLIELKKNKLYINLLEDSDLGLAPPLSFLPRYLNKLSFFLPNVPVGMFICLFYKKFLNKINSYDVIIPTTNTIGLTIGLGKRLNIIRGKIFFISMGLLNKVSKNWHLKLIGFLLEKVELISISETERLFLEKKLNRKVHYIPFGVDLNFWKPKKFKNTKDKFVMAIGNDSNRDWETLIKAWSIDLPLLKIITNLPIKTNSSNIKVIKSSWNENLLSDEYIRKLYCQAKLVILPMKNTMQPSGQSSCIQAMACEKVVIISKIDGIWDKNLMKNLKNVIFVPPEDPISINSAVKKILNNQKELRDIEKNARKLTEEHFNADNMAKSIFSLLNKTIKL